MSKLKKQKNRKNRHSSLQQHKPQGTKLIAKINMLKVNPLEWERDLLVEHLWIASMEMTYAPNVWPVLYNQFMDAIDPFFPAESIPVG